MVFAARRHNRWASMAIRRTGSRELVVDGRAYLWRVRPKPTDMQGLAQSGLVVAVQLASGGCLLAVQLRRARPDNWMAAESVVVTPRDVAGFIRVAIERGWQPSEDGGTFVLSADVGA